MRYSVHPSRAFRNRIAKSIGVLVAAALFATLGSSLPSAAQAQTPAAPMVVATSGATADINVTWGVAPETAGGETVLGWRIEYQEPGEDAMAMYQGLNTTTLDPALEADDPRIHHGLWQFRVSYWSAAAAPMEDDDPAATHLGTPSAWTSYYHGPPTAAPTGLMAHNAGPDARRLVWDTEEGLMYELRSTADATDDEAWTN